MNIDFLNKKIFRGLAAAVLLAMLLCGYFFYALSPMSAQKGAVKSVFEIRSGDGFFQVGNGLLSAGLIRSAFIFDALLFFSGRMSQLEPGEYQLNQAMSAFSIADELTNSTSNEVTVTIPEGSNIREIDGILSNALVIHSGDLVNFHGEGNLEGRLFPDTYHFFTGTAVRAVVQKFLDNFNVKAEPTLGFDESQCAANAACEKNLIIASIVEKEVPDPEDQRIVVGILLKRLATNMYLGLDATICYIKQMADPFSGTGCYPLTALDFKIDSPYNTYSHKGLPPAPIGNPGISAISAALNPESSPYWYYLSDPKTKKTIFAKTLEEQNRNRQRYLGL
jgi:UPF0755 protein